MDSGFIKIHRKLLDWEWYHDIGCKVLFLHLLLRCNWREREWQGRQINRGEVVTSIANLAAETGLSQQQTRTALGKLKTSNVVTVHPTNKYTVISIVNYSVYQGFEEPEQQTNSKPKNNQSTSKQQTNNKQITTTKEVKEVKEGKKERNKEYNTPLSPLAQAVNDFAEHRKGIKKPLTKHGRSLLESKLEKLAPGNDLEKIAILEQSIVNGWTGVFALKDDARAELLKKGGKYESDDRCGVVI